MKLQPDQFESTSITGYGPDWVAVNGEKLFHSLILTSQGQRIDWKCGSFTQLNEFHFKQLADLEVELIIFGSGRQLRFVQGSWLMPLMQQKIGLETMDTQAACRTYNILAGEGRNVAAALLIELTSTHPMD
ncbi:MAG: Mth938-like domain-containing protein [Betaproteobacteria bacterium]|jgi:uncharacterized protein|nr:hypothetical protein [Betaproteobacteria bacterium]NBT66204.1 hypothetical protein [Betaproteobacteria bacterium]NBY09226.1 hypothetical protein [Betaproteobacteria bacterium]